MTEKQTTPEVDCRAGEFVTTGELFGDLKKRVAAGDGGLWGGLEGLTVQEVRWVIIERLRVLTDAQLMEEAKSIITQYWDDCYWLRYGGDCDAPARMMWRLDRVLAALGGRLPEIETHDALCAREFDERRALADREEAAARASSGDV